MAIQTITSPMALDDTLKATNTALGALNTTNGGIAKDTTLQAQNGKLDTMNAKLQAIVDAIGSSSLIGNTDISEIADGTLTGAVAELDSDKVSKETGKGLSTNDYTTAEKTKLSGISTGATKTQASETNGNIKIDGTETPVYRNYGNNTVLATDKTPFLSRQCLTPTGFSSYVREKLIGCSVAWNQLVQNGDFASNTGWYVSSGSTISISGNKATVSKSSSSGYIEFYSSSILGIVGHKYLFRAKVTSSHQVNIFPTGSSSGGATRCNTDGTDTYWIWDALASSISFCFRLIGSSYPADLQASFQNCQIIDLTLAFGSTVADTLYNMANNGGIDWLRNHNYPIDQYTQYGYGLYSSKPSAKKVVGFNTCDEVWETGVLNNTTGQEEADANNIRTKNYISCIPNTQYYVRTASGKYVWIHFYDADKNWISANMMSIGGGAVTSPSNAHYYRTRTTQNYGAVYQNDICINISDTNKNGQYEPYSETTYSLGSTELRGHLIVQNGEIVAEGDVRESNGDVTRKYGIVDLGSLTWTRGGSSSPYYWYADLTGLALYSVLSWSANMICAKYTVPNSIQDESDKVIRPMYSGSYTQARIVLFDSAFASYSASDVKTALDGVKLIYPLATPTTETSSPFADPMSLNGCTTEEYVDDRSIPVPVGHETQYMGQSEDVVQVPSSPQSDGKRKLIAETSGGKTQYYFESDEYNNGGDSVDLISYNSSNNKYVFLNDGYLRIDTTESLVAGFVRAVIQGANDRTVCNEYLYLATAGERHALFVKKGMKCYYTEIPTGVNFKFVPLI